VRWTSHIVLTLHPPCPQHTCGSGTVLQWPEAHPALLAAYPALSECTGLVGTMMKVCLGGAFSGQWAASLHSNFYPSLMQDPEGVPPIQLPYSHCTPLRPVHTFLACSFSVLPPAIFSLYPFYRWADRWIHAYSQCLTL